MKRVAALLITLTLIVGMVGCPAAPVDVELTVSSTSGGSVTSPGEGTFTHEAGKAVDLVAEAEQGYRFVNWTGDVDTIVDVNAASTTITMNGNYDIRANFVAQHILTIGSTDGGSVTAPGEGTFTYEEGTVVGLVVRAEVGYQFLSWVGDVDTIADTGNPSTTVRMDGQYAITATFEAEEAVFFADANLEAAVREAIDVPERPIYASDLEGLVFLDAGNRSITDLTGLEHCPGLSLLVLVDNEITDIMALASLTGLTNLELSGNQVVDISPLTDLAKLTSLSLASNRIGDISPLANLTNLIELELCCNDIGDADLLHLANLSKLTTLYIGSNQISDISPLASLTKLTRLDLWNNQITDVSPLANLTGLTWLELERNQISDISPLANLTSLTNLNVIVNQIDDIGPLADLTNLATLYVTVGSVSDVPFLASLNSVTELRLQINRIADDELFHLADLAGILYELQLGHQQIRDISSLACLTNLRALGLDKNLISDMSPLAGLASLRHLWISGNQIDDVSPLAKLSNLMDLHLRYNRISDISPLAGLTDLRRLYLDSNDIVDVSPLARLTRLGQIKGEWGWEIIEREGLEIHLGLAGNRIADIASLVENEGLSQQDGIDLRGNPLSSDSLNIHIPELEKRGVNVLCVGP